MEFISRTLLRDFQKLKEKRKKKKKEFQLTIYGDKKLTLLLGFLNPNYRFKKRNQRDDNLVVQ